MLEWPRYLDHLAAAKRSPWLLTHSNRRCGSSRTHIRPVQSQPNRAVDLHASVFVLEAPLDDNAAIPEHALNASQHRLADTLAFHFVYFVFMITRKHNGVEIHRQKASQRLQWQLSAANIHLKIELGFRNFGWVLLLYPFHDSFFFLSLSFFNCHQIFYELIKGQHIKSFAQNVPQG